MDHSMISPNRALKLVILSADWALCAKFKSNIASHFIFGCQSVINIRAIGHGEYPEKPLYSFWLMGS